MSCRKVPPVVRIGAPISLFCSITRTEAPLSATSRAAARPPGPPPATTTSYVRIEDSLPVRLPKSIGTAILEPFYHLVPLTSVLQGPYRRCGDSVECHFPGH